MRTESNQKNQETEKYINYNLNREQERFIKAEKVDPTLKVSFADLLKKSLTK